MIMIQHFAIDHGEWVCAGCAAPMVMEPGPDPLAPAERVVMTHAAHCPEVSGEAPAGA